MDDNNEKVYTIKHTWGFKPSVMEALESLTKIGYEVCTDDWKSPNHVTLQKGKHFLHIHELVVP